MKLKSTIAIIIVIISLSIKMNAQKVTFEKSKAFHPSFIHSTTKKIVWGYLTVPENWGSNDGKTIKIAVTILKNISEVKNPDVIVYIEGGPGASGIENIWNWIEHPLRQKNDIILFDFRGTGYSLPRLCPDFGEKIMEVLAKNQTPEKDESQKLKVALQCQQDIMSKGINLDSYNSLAVSNDLHALKEALNYKSWNVYGVSYGTYVAQIYASNYPKDIKSLVLDSPISDISTYYEKNTQNYMNSLKKVFKMCQQNPITNKQYPNLEKVYYKVISDLEKNPITTTVDTLLIRSGKFTYNTEDFKIAIHQALYNKKLIEVIPLLIYQFDARNEKALANLIPAFSSLLGMDFGVYYCVTCNEVIPFNNYLNYQSDSIKFNQLHGGVSFYKSDFKICNEWNKRAKESETLTNLSNLSKSDFKTLVFSGEFDPITPLENGNVIAEKINNAYNIEAYTYGHASGFSEIGSKVAENFINNPNQKPNKDAFKKASKNELVSGVIINNGVAKMGTTLGEQNPIFLFPLVIAIGILLFFIFSCLIKLIKRRYNSVPNKIVRIGILITSVLGLILITDLVLALLEVSNKNQYILVFGLFQNHNYIFLLMYVFIAFLAFTVLYFLASIKKINGATSVFTIIYANILVVVYLLYWGIL